MMKHPRLKAAVLVLCVLAACAVYGYGEYHDRGKAQLLLSEVQEERGSGGLPAEEDDRSGNSLISQTRASGNVIGDAESGSEKEADGIAIPGDRGTGAPDSVSGDIGSDTPGGSSSALPGGNPPCYVHICGEVVSPGVYEVDTGSRIFEVVEKAGGFTDQAASDYLNMAQAVCDGMKIVVPGTDEVKKWESDAKESKTAAGESGPQCIIMPEPSGLTAGGGISGAGASGAGGGISGAGGGIPGAGGGVSGAAGDGSAGGKVNINTATMEELMTLSGIGESKASDIIKYREEHGAFQKIEDIMKISGIKNAAFSKIKDDITV